MLLSFPICNVQFLVNLMISKVIIKLTNTIISSGSFTTTTPGINDNIILLLVHMTHFCALDKNVRLRSATNKAQPVSASIEICEVFFLNKLSN